MDKTIAPTIEQIKDGAMVLYKHGYLEPINGHIRFFDTRPDGSIEWTAGSSDDVTDYVICWFRKIDPHDLKEIK